MNFKCKYDNNTEQEDSINEYKIFDNSQASINKNINKKNVKINKKVEVKQQKKTNFFFFFILKNRLKGINNLICDKYNIIFTNSKKSIASKISMSSSNTNIKNLPLYHEKSNKSKFRINHYFMVLTNVIFKKKKMDTEEKKRSVPFCMDVFTMNDYFNYSYYDPSQNCLIDKKKNVPFVSNSVRSSKYTIYSFLPKQIKAQFSKFANFYFLIVSSIQMIPNWSTTGTYTSIFPLLIFISISIFREGYDDWKRYVNDNEENNKLATIIEYNAKIKYEIHSKLNNNDLLYATKLLDSINSNSIDLSHLFQNESFLNLKNLRTKIIKWKDLKVGDLVKVNENEFFPADIVLLNTSNTSSQISYVDTMVLDGETNLKLKYPHPELLKLMSNIFNIKDIKFLMEIENPNIDLYNFNGQFILNGKLNSLMLDNIVFRGSKLKNTNFVLGIVVFTGEETKIRMNNIKNPRIKAPKLQSIINYIVIFMVVMVFLLTIFSTLIQRLLYNNTKNKAWYLCKNDAGIISTFMSFIIMYNTLIPLSLYGTMEIIKVMQLLFLQFDIDMYHLESNTPADAKTATILEELGQVSYIFSDKTGTLTENLMIFKKFSVCGLKWFHNDNENLKKLNNGIDTVKSKKKLITNTDPIEDDLRNKEKINSSFDSNIDNQSILNSSFFKIKKNQETKDSKLLIEFIQKNPELFFSCQVKFFLLCIVLCNNCIPRIVLNKEKKFNTDLNFDHKNLNSDKADSIIYQSTSPDEDALIKAAQELGYIMIERNKGYIYLKSYPLGFQNEPIFEKYKVLNTIDFSSSRKRMSIIVKFPDNKICLICKGADNVILERLKDLELAFNKSKDISINSKKRKNLEAGIILQSKVSFDIPSKKSTGSIRQSLNLNPHEIKNMKINNLDDMFTKESEIANVALQNKKSLHSLQAQRYSFDYKSYKFISQGGIRDVDNNFELDYDDIFLTDRLISNKDFFFEKTLEHLEEFSVEGLRTLLYSYRWIDENEYYKWSDDYEEAKSCSKGRILKVETVAEKIENNLNLIGVTGIEDRLQDGVVESIEKLRRAGIKIWMLTGDKKETAINVGFLCKLIKDYSKVIIISNDNDSKTLIDQIMTFNSDIKSSSIAHSVIIIDGKSLTFIENEPNLFTLFIELCLQADSVICCRSSPYQKAKMVSAIRNLKKNAVTLAIGDGANDIAMIQSADIGIGITGKEGLQAARSADYAFSQFKYLVKLILVNGRYNYVRTTKFILSTFYKEVLFYLSQCIYQRNTLFSGTSIFESWSLSLFNTLFTSLPVICIGMFDKDLEPSTLIAIPELYSKGRLYKGLNLKIFISWIVLAIVQSLSVSFISYYAWGSSSLNKNSILSLGTMIFIALIIIINVKCEFIEMQNKTWFSFASFFISIGIYFFWTYIISKIYDSEKSQYFMDSDNLKFWLNDINWWITLLFITVVPIFLDILIKVSLFIFKPSDDDLFRFYEKDAKMKLLFEKNSRNFLSHNWVFPKKKSKISRLIILISNLIKKKLKLK